MVESPDVALKTGSFFLLIVAIGQVLLMIATSRGHLTSYLSSYREEPTTLPAAAGIGFGFAIALVHLLNGGHMYSISMLAALGYFVLGTAISEMLFRTVY